MSEPDKCCGTCKHKRNANLNVLVRLDCWIHPVNSHGFRLPDEGKDCKDWENFNTREARHEP